MSRSRDNWMAPWFRMLVLLAISRTREIKCEKCGTYEGIELHHTKYYPEAVTIFDIQLLCFKCHRNAKRGQSMIRTVFMEGKRFCVASNYGFEY